MLMKPEIKKQLFESALLDEKYYKYTYPSGFSLYVYPKKMSTVYAIFGVKYGSVDNQFKTHDGAQLTVPDGIAHFLEHKLFFNEDGSDSFERFSELGTDPNAYTSFNKTAYLFSCTDHFDEALCELIDFVTHPYFTEESVESEKGIILEEMRMYDDSPGDRCFYGMLEGMYEHHSIRRNICGTERSISEISAPLLYSCYNAFYRPSNMSLTVCGDVDVEQVNRLVLSRLPESFSGDAVGKINENSLEAPQAFKPLVEQKMQVAKPIFNIGFKDTDIPGDPRQRQKKDAVMAILNEMLFSRAGEFYSSLFERHLISPAMSYGYTISETFAYNSIAGEADDPKLVLKEVTEYLAKVRSQGLCQEDFNRAKRVMFAESVKLFDSTESIANTLFSFICEDAEIFEYADILGGVTLEDVSKAFEQSFLPSTVTLSVVYPLNEN